MLIDFNHYFKSLVIRTLRCGIRENDGRDVQRIDTRGVLLEQRRVRQLPTSVSDDFRCGWGGNYCGRPYFLEASRVIFTSDGIILDDFKAYCQLSMALTTWWTA